MTALLSAGVIIGANSHPFYTKVPKVSVGEQILDVVSDTGKDPGDTTGAVPVKARGYDGRPVFSDGMAQPMLEYSDDSTPNEDSDIIRFCVYVETDHDTDGDGMADLVKVFCQVPKGAASGKYKAGVIYDPEPSSAGVTKGLKSEEIYRFTPDGFDYKKLYEPGRKRQPKGELNTTGVALRVDSSDWHYDTPVGDVDLADGRYDYFLTRGFAVVKAFGIGTYGSEGYELCGMDLERDAHRCVVEWLAGDRIAYTDKENEIRIKADWSNRKVAMTGTSYAGALAFETAATGVKGLKTIISFDGIASWYDQANSQGASIRSEGNFTDLLAFDNSGADFIDESWIVGDENYGAYLKQVRLDGKSAYGNYTDLWRAMDYTGDYENIRCPALIIHGLNDFNVQVKHSANMYNAFKKAGQEVKLILHQGAGCDLYGKEIDGELFDDIMNRWLCHYLYDMDNGIEEDIPEVTVQSNVDGSFFTYDSYGEFRMKAVDLEYADRKYTVNNQDYDTFCESNPVPEAVTREGWITGLSSDEGEVLETGLMEGDTIFGSARLNVRLKADKKMSWEGDPDDRDLERSDELLGDNLMVSAYLIDVAEEDEYFHAYMNSKRIDDFIPVRASGKYGIGQGHEDNSVYEYVQSPADCKVVTCGWMDLCDPGAGSDMSEYVREDEFVFGEYNDYTLVFDPTHYTLLPGHKLKLVITGQDGYELFTDPGERLDLMMKKYSFEIDNESALLEIPMVN